MELYISTWNFHKHILLKQANLEDFPALAKDNGFQGIEVMDRQLNLDNEKYIAGFSRRIKDKNCRLILAVTSDLTYPIEQDWLEQVQYVQKALEAAAKLGAQKVRILLGGQSMSFQKIFNNIRRENHFDGMNTSDSSILEKLIASKKVADITHFFRRNINVKPKDAARKSHRAILAIQKLLPLAEELEIPMVIENHWGISTRPDTILTIVNKINSNFLGTCPDFTNFPRETDPYKALSILAKDAMHVHAKSRRFDAQGEEKNIDFGRCIRILKKIDYQSSITIEYGGRGNVMEGCLKTARLIHKHWKIKRDNSPFI